MFTPNWVRLGFKSREESVAHIFSFLKKHEKQILKHSLYGATTIWWGVGNDMQMSLTLGKESEEVGLEKKHGK